MVNGDRDDREVVDLNVGGDDPVQQARAMLSGYDIDGDISRIRVQIFERQPPDDPDPIPPVLFNEDGPDPSEVDHYRDGMPEGTKIEGRTKLTEADREQKGIRAQTSYHLVLACLEAIDSDEISAADIADALNGNVGKKNVSTVLSKLFKRRLADRNEGQKPYTYWITAHGRDVLNGVGRDVDRDAVGGVWATDDGGGDGDAP